MASRAGKPVSGLRFTYPSALPALFLAGAFAAGAGFAADVLAAGATGARALLTASDFGLLAAFFTAAFLAGFFVGSVAPAFFCFFFAGSFLPPLGLAPPLAAPLA